MKFTRFLILVLSCLTGSVLAQSPEIPAATVRIDQNSIPTKSRPNTISLTTDLRAHFDGNAVFGVPTISGKYFAYLGWGIDYQRLFDHINGLDVGLSVMGIWYAPPQKPANGWSGIVRERFVASLNAHYLRTLVARARWKVFGVGGLNFRYGNEYIEPWFWGDSDIFYQDGYRLRDLGLSLGARTTYALTPWLQASAELRFTEYVYRYDRERPYTYTNYAGKGATRHQSTLQLGLGYRF